MHLFLNIIAGYYILMGYAMYFNVFVSAAGRNILAILAERQTSDGSGVGLIPKTYIKLFIKYG